MATLFSGGLLFDGEAAPIDGQGVLVEAGRVKEVAPRAEFDGFAGAEVDTAGGTLLPGLIDCHIHLCLGGEADPGTAADRLSDAGMSLKALERAQATLRGGVIGVRDCGGRDFIELEVRDAIGAGCFTGPTVKACGRVICMTGGHGARMGRVADGVDDVVKAVRENIHAGADVIKIMATGGVMTPGVNPEDAHYSAAEMAAGIAEARRFSRSTASHAQGAEGILNAVLGGVTSIEHGIFMDERCLEEMLAAGTYLVPTLSAVANIVLHRDQGIPSWAVEKAERVLERHKESFRTYYQAGGRIAMGTDAGTPFNRHGENTQELRYMVENGMTPIDALRSSTGIAAALCQLTDNGRIAVGMAADFLIVEGNPAQDIGRVADHANHRLVLKNGTAAAGAAKLGPGGARIEAAASY